MLTTIEAGPGTGKTFTLVNGHLQITKNLRSSLDLTEEQEQIFQYFKEEYRNHNIKACFFSFNSSIRDEIKNRLSRTKCDVYTFHGAGQSVITRKFGYQKLVYNRTESMFQRITGINPTNLSPQEKKNWADMKKVLQFLKLEDLPANEESLHYLSTKYPAIAELSLSPEALPILEQALEFGLHPDGTIEYIDMLWMGRHWCRKPRYHLGYIDESQDISTISYKLVSAMCENLICVGDTNQRINGWAGGSEKVHERIKAKSDAVFPLKMTQRCPDHICEKANNIRSGGIIPGFVGEIGEDKTIAFDAYPKHMSQFHPSECLTLSRKNSHLVRSALYLYRNKVKCYILDRDLGKTLSNKLKMFKTEHLPELKQKVSQYRNANWMKPESKRVREEEADTLLYILNSVNHFSEISTLLKKIFSPPKKTENPKYMLTTIHKAKGLEAERVYVLFPPIPLQHCLEHPMLKEDEINLEFVAVTRSKDSIYWVSE